MLSNAFYGSPYFRDKHMSFMEAQESKYSVCNPILDFLETWYHRSNEKWILLTATRFDNHEHLEKLSKANL